MLKKISTLLATVLLSGAAALAQATTVLDFNDFVAPGSGITEIGSYQGAGYVLSAGPGGAGLVTVGNGDPSFFAGSPALALADAGVVILSRNDGSAFNLLSIDLAPLLEDDCKPTPNRAGCVVSLSFIGYRADGSTVTSLINTPEIYDFTTYGFTGFENLVSVNWIQSLSGEQNSPLFQFDNIVLDQPLQVPEPAPLLLLGLGMAGLLAVRRLRRA